MKCGKLPVGNMLCRSIEFNDCKGLKAKKGCYLLKIASLMTHLCWRLSLCSNFVNLFCFHIALLNSVLLITSAFTSYN